MTESQVVVFSIVNEEFGVDIHEVREIIKTEAVTRMPNTAPWVRGVINLRGNIIVVVDLAMRLGMPSQNLTKNTRIIVVEVSGSSVGMVVDGATEVLRLAENQIQPTPGVIASRINAEYLRGVGIIGERLLILLDLERVFEAEDVQGIERIQQSALVPAAPHEAPRRDAPHPLLKDVHYEWHFITHEAKPLKNVHELLQYIRTLDEETFRLFVNEEKNDFANWVKHCVKDDDLAERIARVKSKEDVSKEIVRRILEVRE